MIVKAEILNIDYATNLCDIRIPLFESAAGGDKAIASATIACPPGVYNGYKDGDVVLVAFENGQIQNPVVIGKLYLGADTENKEPRGTVNCSSLVSNSANSIDVRTELNYNNKDTIISEDSNTLQYKNILDIINKKADNNNTIHTNNKETITGDKTVAVGAKLIFADQSEITHSIYSDGKDKLLINRKDNTVMLFNKANTVVNNDLRINAMGTAATSAATKSYVDNYLTTITGYKANVAQTLEHDDQGNIKWVNK